MEAKEILYCDLIVIKDKKEISIKGVVLLEGETIYKNMPIKDIHKIKSLGFQTLSTGHTVVQKSEEKRNNVTGAYD